MPKNTQAAGPTYAGHVDTAPHKSQPEWDLGGETADADPLAVFAGELDDEVSRETPKRRGRPPGSKNKPKTVAQAGNAAAQADTRA